MMYFLLILLLNIELSSIHALQSSEKIDNENLLENYFNQYKEPNKQEEDIQTIIKSEIEKIDNEMNQLQKKTNQMTQNSTADNIMRENKKALNKEELKPANRMLLQIRDYLYYVENICLKSINRTSSTPPSNSKSSTMQANNAKRYNRWMVFFDQCNHEDFLAISTKIENSLDRSIFFEQIEVLQSLTNNFKVVGMKKQWYRKTIYSKQSLLESLKKHMTLDDNFLIFFKIMYDIVVAFQEQWEVND